jgi:hypothetical protein
MGAFADEIDRSVKAGRKEMNRTLDMLDSRLGPTARRRGGVLAALALAALAAFGIGMAYERRRRRRTLAERIHNVLPSVVRDLPEEVASQLKRPIEKVRARVQQG